MSVGEDCLAAIRGERRSGMREGGSGGGIGKIGGGGIVRVVESVLGRSEGVEVMLWLDEGTVLFEGVTVLFEELTVLFEELTVLFEELTVLFEEVTVLFEEVTVLFEVTLLVEEGKVELKEGDESLSKKGALVELEGETVVVSYGGETGGPGEESGAETIMVGRSGEEIAGLRGCGRIVVGGVVEG